jgi:hypothetical protein
MPFVINLSCFISLQSETHQRLPKHPIELAGPGSHPLVFPPADGAPPLPSFLLPHPHPSAFAAQGNPRFPPASVADHRSSNLSIRSARRSHNDHPASKSNSDEEDPDDPSIVTPPWTEPQTVSKKHGSGSKGAVPDKILMPAAAASATTASGMSLSETSAPASLSCLKVRVDILKTPLDKLQQLGRNLEEPR